MLRKLKIYFQLFPGKHGTDAERGVSGVDYTLKVDGRTVDQGKTAADGSVEVLVPAGQPAELVLLGTSYDLKIDNYLDAVGTVAGQQRRLSMLGYDVGTIDGQWGENSDRATLDFQGDEALDPDGAAGANTQNKLRSVFGE
ncbi:peptidoglycan-binding protein [Pendulispora rubella]|uniref:Peptidoglycan-binding protein n=1 Tax=Pendulispora rubella TaxID=2741070 RepID=A0ABZ2LDK5_9BACT